jgi:hypothetical protein
VRKSLISTEALSAASIELGAMSFEKSPRLVGGFSFYLDLKGELISFPVARNLG